jgi:hypothetical protein
VSSGLRYQNDCGGYDMKTSRRSFASRLAIVASALGLATAASGTFAGTLASTTDAAAWTVSTAFHGDGSGDGLLASFDTNPADFTAAVERSDAPGWIANIASGSNGTGIGQWTFFVFEQTVTLTSAEVADGLKFQWAADDSGQVFATRGSWTPKFSVDGGGLIPGDWGPGGDSYSLGAITDVTAADGLHEGVNTLMFYVEGNGITDGMSLVALPAVPEPGSPGLFAAGLGLLGVMMRRAKRNAG